MCDMFVHCQVGIQVNNSLLLKQQDETRQRTEGKASPCKYLNIVPAEHTAAAAVYPWALIRPFLTHNDTAARFVAELSNYFTTQSDTDWALALLQLLRDDVQTLLLFQDQCDTAAVSTAAATTPAAMHDTAGWSSGVLSLWVLLVALRVWCIRLQTLDEVSTHYENIRVYRSGNVQTLCASEPQAR
jgi:hypothetical protein